MHTGVAVEASDPALAPLYRYWGNNNHFYTTNFNELGDGARGYRLEGVAAIIHSKRVPGTVPLYRYFKSNPTDHFYTTNANEIGVTTPGFVGRHGYKSEGIAGYVYSTQKHGTVPLHRYWKASITDHFYTVDTNEIGAHLRPGQSGRHGYVYEGVACYVYP